MVSTRAPASVGVGELKDALARIDRDQDGMINFHVIPELDFHLNLYKTDVHNIKLSTGISSIPSTTMIVALSVFRDSCF